MKPIKLQIKTKSQEYPIIIGNNLVSNFIKITNNCSLKFDKCLLVIDKNVSKKILKKIIKSLNLKYKKKLIFINTKKKNLIGDNLKIKKMGFKFNYKFNINEVS